jgi:hypothetical protein
MTVEERKAYYAARSVYFVKNGSEEVEELKEFDPSGTD